jgi:hypothetical protein
MQTSPPSWASDLLVFDPVNREAKNLRKPARMRRRLPQSCRDGGPNCVRLFPNAGLLAVSSGAASTAFASIFHNHDKALRRKTQDRPDPMTGTDRCEKRDKNVAPTRKQSVASATDPTHLGNVTTGAIYATTRLSTMHFIDCRKGNRAGADALTDAMIRQPTPPTPGFAAPGGRQASVAARCDVTLCQPVAAGVSRRVSRLAARCHQAAPTPHTRRASKRAATLCHVNHWMILSVNRLARPLRKMPPFGYSPRQGSCPGRSRRYKARHPGHSERQKP